MLLLLLMMMNLFLSVVRLRGRINVASVDVDSSKKLRHRFQITRCPTYILLVRLLLTFALLVVISCIFL